VRASPSLGRAARCAVSSICQQQQQQQQQPHHHVPGGTALDDVSMLLPTMPCLPAAA